MHSGVLKGIRVLRDAKPGHGPLGGLHTALLEAESCQLQAVLLLACDLPFVGERVIAAIAAQAETSWAAALRRPGGGTTRWA